MPRRLFSCRPKIQLCLSLFTITLTRSFVQVQAISSPRFRRGERFRNQTFKQKNRFLRVGHFVPRWWDILSQGGGTFCPKVTLSPQVQALYARNAKTAPICILPKYIFPIWGLLNRRAPSSPLGYAAVRRRKDLASLGLFWGALPDPPDPPETPTKGSSPRADALATLGLSAPKGYNPFRLRHKRQALVLASLRSSAALMSSPCGHEFAA